jgi:hypothetical protein
MQRPSLEAPPVAQSMTHWHSVKHPQCVASPTPRHQAIAVVVDAAVPLWPWRVVGASCPASSLVTGRRPPLHLVKEIENHVMEHDMSSVAEAEIFFRCDGIIRINWLNMYNVTMQELTRKFHVYLLLLCTNIGVFHIYVHKFQPSH